MAVTRVCGERTFSQKMQTFLFTFLKLLAKFRFIFAKKMRKRYEISLQSVSRKNAKFRFNLFREKMQNIRILEQF